MGRALARLRDEKKTPHNLIAWINLREDIVVECNGATYSWRDTHNLDRPIVMHAASDRDLQVHTVNDLDKIFQIVHLMIDLEFLGKRKRC